MMKQVGFRQYVEVPEPKKKFYVVGLKEVGSEEYGDHDILFAGARGPYEIGDAQVLQEELARADKEGFWYAVLPEIAIS
jgi:hypothetical protein